MDKIIKKILRLVKKEEKHHIPTIDEIKKENEHLMEEEKKLSKLLRPAKKSARKKPCSRKK